MKYIIINILGIILISTSLTYIISYLNLLDIGYNFIEYVYFIIRRIECLILIPGIIILILNNKEK